MHSENHWSNQQTMQQWIKEVLLPYSERRIHEHNLPRDSHIILLLDAWAVHKSEEFRLFLQTHFPHIHLVYVPANCTGQLQVADVVLQRPFKHGIRQRFSLWCADILREQVRTNDLLGLAPYLKMSQIKPRLLEWVVSSWSKLQQGRDYIKMGWHSCVTSMFDVHDPVKRAQVVEDVALQQLEAKAFIPAGDEEVEEANESEHDEDEQKDELDILKERQFGSRKSARKRQQAHAFGHQLVSSQIQIDSDSDSN